MRNLKVYALSLLAFSSLFAQQNSNRIDLSGTWTLDVHQSSFGSGPSAKSASCLIKQSPKKVEIRTRWDPSSTPGMTTVALVPDGKEHPAASAAGTFDVKSRSHWEGNAIMAEFEQQPPFGQDFPKSKWTTRYSLSADRKVLIVDKKVFASGAMPAFDQHLVFLRQN